MSSFPGVTLTSATSSSPVLIDLDQNLLWRAPPHYAIGLICTVSSGASLTYSVQVTGDQVPSANGFWNEHDVITGVTTSMNSNIAYPVTAIRLKVTSYTSGSVHLGVAMWP
jgi:hypothetical protein